MCFFTENMEVFWYNLLTSWWSWYFWRNIHSVTHRPVNLLTLTLPQTALGSGFSTHWGPACQTQLTHHKYALRLCRFKQCFVRMAASICVLVKTKISKLAGRLSFIYKAVYKNISMENVSLIKLEKSSVGNYLGAIKKEPRMKM